MRVNMPQHRQLIPGYNFLLCISAGSTN